MNDTVIIYTNELKNRIVPKYKIIGIVSQLIFSTSIFQTNHEIKPFLSDVFGLTFKPYVFKSRTLVVARISKEVSKTTSNELESIKRKLYKFLTENLSEEKKLEPIITRGAHQIEK